METKNKSLAAIKEDVVRHQEMLQQIHTARQEVRGYTTATIAQRGEASLRMLLAMPAAAAVPRTFNLLAQGDSWFDYPPGTDLIDCLHAVHGHTITNIAVAGSTLNDEAYGPVPHEMFGLPFGPLQSGDLDRITELVSQITQGNEHGKFTGLLLSAGGNDIAGDEFFSFINNARSGLEPINNDVLKGVVNGTFKTAFQYLIDTALAAGANQNPPLKVFTHGYDYPWPDGRGLISFIAWRIGPWFDDTFNHKNYPNTNPGELYVRHKILMTFIDAVNAMLIGLAADPKYAGRLFHVDLRTILKTPADWANELHPGNAGFRALAVKIDAALQANL